MSNGWSGILFAVVATTVLAASGAAAETVPAPVDTLRTNIWLVEALMADIVHASEQVLPAAPASILLAPRSESPENELYGTTAFRMLSARGYDVYAAAETEDEDPLHEIRYGFAVAGVELAYPEVGRTLGLWRRWVQRDLEVAVYLTVTEASSGRILLTRRVSRSFSDRVPSDEFESVESPLYSFTSAETAESGWQRRLEEIVVLGALAGLVVIYFSNTNN